MKQDKITIGKINSVHGLKGELKVTPLTSDIDRFYDLEHIFLARDGQYTAYDVEHVRLHKKNILMVLAGIEDRTQAEACIGNLLAINREEAVELKEDEYFIADLIGMQVVTSDQQMIGKVTNILQNSGSIDNIEIETSDKKIYVPLRKVYFKNVDLATKTILADIPQAFFEL